MLAASDSPDKSGSLRHSQMFFNHTSANTHFFKAVVQKIGSPPRLAETRTDPCSCCITALSGKCLNRMFSFELSHACSARRCNHRTRFAKLEKYPNICNKDSEGPECIVVLLPDDETRDDEKVPHKLHETTESLSVFCGNYINHFRNRGDGNGEICAVVVSIELDESSTSKERL